MVGFNWKNVFVDGNKFGVGFGLYLSYVILMKGDSSFDDENFVFEVYYDYQVSDNVMVIFVVFWVQDVDGNVLVDGFDIFGVLVKIIFKF